MEVNEPLQPEEEGSESDSKEEKEEPTPPPVPSTLRPVIKSQPRSPMYNTTSKEVVPNETSVFPLLFCYFINSLKMEILV